MGVDPLKAQRCLAEAKVPLMRKNPWGHIAAISDSDVRWWGRLGQRRIYSTWKKYCFVVHLDLALPCSLENGVTLARVFRRGTMKPGVDTIYWASYRYAPCTIDTGQWTPIIPTEQPLGRCFRRPGVGVL